MIFHEFEIPVILRTTTRVSHSCGDVEVEAAEPVPVEVIEEGFVKDRRWTIFPKLTAERHPWLESVQKKLSERFSELSFNSLSGSGRIGIIASGVSALYVKEAIEAVRGFEELFTLFRVGTVYPFPEKAALSFLKGIDRLIVAEELDPYLEEQALQLIGKAHLPVDVYGKKNGFFPVSGEYNVDIVIDSINRALAAYGESLRLSHDFSRLVDVGIIANSDVYWPDYCRVFYSPVNYRFIADHDGQRFWLRLRQNVGHNVLHVLRRSRSQAVPLSPRKNLHGDGGRL